MTLLSFIIALLLEHWHPLPRRAWRLPVARMAAMLEDRFNDGGRSHGAIAWGLGVAAPAALTGLLYLLLLHYQPVLAFLLGIVVLYLSLGFRQASDLFGQIHQALRSGELDQARLLLAQWRGHGGDHLGASEIARLAIEQALLSSLRQVFAPLLWYVVLGPAGALLYRLAYCFDELWGGRSELEFGQFGQFARQAFVLIERPPLLVTAASFAVVGDFEDAVHCWRTQADRWPDPGSGILLASGAGALGVRLGMPVHDMIQEVGEFGDRPDLGLGEDADAEFMQSTIGLVWRSLVLGLAVMALVGVSGWVG